MSQGYTIVLQFDEDITLEFFLTLLVVAILEAKDGMGFPGQHFSCILDFV